MPDLNTGGESINTPKRGGITDTSGVYSDMWPAPVFPAVTSPPTTKQFNFTDPAAVPHQSGATPGPGASRTDLAWGSIVDPADTDGSKVTDNDWDDPQTAAISLTHEHPAFGRASGAKYK